MKRTIHIQIIDIEKMQQTGIKVTGSGVIDRVEPAVLGGCWFDASEVFFPMKSYDFMEV